MSELENFLTFLEEKESLTSRSSRRLDDADRDGVSPSNEAYNTYTNLMEKPKSSDANEEAINAYIEAEEASKTTAPVPSSDKKTLTQLENNPKFAKIANRFLESVGEDDDIFEYLRDSDYSLTSAALRAVKTNSWTEQQASDYTYLREQFDNAELSGFKERFNFVKDFSIDVLTDPINILAAIFSIPTLGGSVATRGALAMASKEGLKKLTASQLGKRKALRKAKVLKGAKRGAALGAIEGAAWAGPHEYFLQDIDVDLGNRDKIDLGVVAGVTTLGGIFGGTIGGGLAAASALKRSNYLNKKKFKHTNENEIEVKGNQPREEVLETSRMQSAVEAINPIKEKAEKNLYNFLAKTIAKPTAELIPWLENSTALRKVLTTLNPDLGYSVLKKKKAGVKEFGFGERVTALRGDYLGSLKVILNKADRAADRKLLGIMPVGNKLSKTMNDNIGRMLRDEKMTIHNVKDVEGIDGITKEIYIGIRKILDRNQKDLENAGLVKKGFGYIVGYLPRIYNYSHLMKNRTKFEGLLIKAGHANPTKSANKKSGIKTDLATFGVDFRKQARETLNLPEAKLTDVRVTALAKELKAAKIVDDMLENKYKPFEASRSSSSPGYVKTRTLKNLDDNEIAEFLENDVETILKEYFESTSLVIARTEKFGRTAANMELKWIGPIRKELMASSKAAGLDKNAARESAEKVIEQTKKIVFHVTGIESPRINNKAASVTNDAILLSQQLAHLPFVTISSISEPLILFSRAAAGDSPLVARDIASAVTREVGNSLDATIRSIRRMRGQTTKDSDSFVGAARLKLGLKKLDDADWKELYMAGLGMEQGIQARLAGLVGEEMQTSTLKKLSNGFFKLTFLTQWTKAVQLASFTTGKRLIKQRAEALYNHQEGGKLIKLSGEGRFSTKRYYEEQLEDLGVDPKEAIAWYKKSLDNGVYNQTKGEAQSFYNDRLIAGATRFAKEIILDTSTTQANRPLWFSHPAARLLTQFAAYPTVFNNTILKRWANESINNPTQALPKIAMTTVAMTAVAHLGNTLRSGGENYYHYNTGEEKTPLEMAGEGIRRFGGYGPFDYAQRYGRSAEAGSGGITSVLKTFAGPFPQDIIDAVAYRRGVGETIAQNVPFYQALPSETKKALRKAGRDFDKGPKEEKVKKKKPKKKEDVYIRYAKSKGGIVYDVPNASVEPDERIDKMTGVPYDEQAGVIMRDEEERGVVSLEDLRLGFNEGGNIEKVVADLLTFIAKKRGYGNTNRIEDYARQVAWQESRGKGYDIVQEGGGPARGKYQVEGYKGSRRNDTMIQRAINFYEKNPDAPKSKKIEYVLTQKGKDLDFSTLSEETQDALFYIDAEAGTLPLDDVQSGELNFREAWIKHWNQDLKAQKTIKDKDGNIIDNPKFDQNVLNERIKKWDEAREEAKRKAEAERQAAELAALQKAEETDRVAMLPSTQDGVPPSSDTVEPLANEPQFNRANVNQGGLVNVLYKRSQKGRSTSACG